MEKIPVLILVLSTIFFILSSLCYYAKCGPKCGMKYELLPASKVLKYLRNTFYPHNM